MPCVDFTVRLETKTGKAFRKYVYLVLDVDQTYQHIETPIVLMAKAKKHAFGLCETRIRRFFDLALNRDKLTAEEAIKRYKNIFIVDSPYYRVRTETGAASFEPVRHEYLGMLNGERGTLKSIAERDWISQIMAADSRGLAR